MASVILKVLGAAFGIEPPTGETLTASEEYAILGAKLAEFADALEAKLRADGKEPMERCASCAFRAGTVPNTKAPHTTMDAVKCLIEHHPFGCHHDKVDGLPSRLCGGFVNILAATTDAESKPGKAPWPWSDEILAGIAAKKAGAAEASRLRREGEGASA